MDFLTNKLGPLPAWAWGAVVGGTLLVASYLRRGSEPAPAPVADQDGLGDPYALPASGAVLPWYDAGGAATDAVGSGIPPELIDRLGAIEDRIAQQPPAPTLEESLEELRRIQDAARQVIDQPAPPSAAPPAPAPPPPPPPPAPAPAPPSPTFAQPISGQHVWQGAAEPNMGTIRALLAARYGRVVPTKTVRPGGGGFLVVVK